MIIIILINTYYSIILPKAYLSYDSIHYSIQNVAFAFFVLIKPFLSEKEEKNMILKKLIKMITNTTVKLIILLK